jgi:hypothetical protein
MTAFVGVPREKGDIRRATLGPGLRKCETNTSYTLRPGAASVEAYLYSTDRQPPAGEGLQPSALGTVDTKNYEES